MTDTQDTHSRIDTGQTTTESSPSTGWRETAASMHAARAHAVEPGDADGGLSLDRWASRRGEYLESTTMLSRSASEAVAYSERGFSDGGIAKQIDSTAGTVTQYLDRAVARFGPGVRLPCLDEHPPIEADLAPVVYEDLAEWSQQERDVWHTAVDRHPEYEPPAVEETERRARATAPDAPEVADG